MSGPDDRHLTRRAVVMGLAVTAFARCAGVSAAPDDTDLSQRFVVFDDPARIGPVALLDRRGRSAVLAPRPGRTSLIVLWANWCPACHREVPALAAAQHDMARAGIDIAVVNVDSGSQPRISIRSSVVPTGDLQSFYDPDGARLTAPSADGRRSPLQLFGIPILFAVDRAGLVRGYMKGDVDWANPTVIAFFQAIGNAAPP